MICCCERILTWAIDSYSPRWWIRSWGLWYCCSSDDCLIRRDWDDEVEFEAYIDSWWCNLDPF